MDIEKLYNAIAEKRKLNENASLPVCLTDKNAVVWFYYTDDVSQHSGTVNSIVIANQNLEVVKVLKNQESKELIAVDFSADFLSEAEYYEQFLTCRSMQDCLNLISKTEEKPFLRLYEHAIALALSINGNVTNTVYSGGMPTDDEML